jgi:hypothetical protein
MIPPFPLFPKSINEENVSSLFFSPGKPNLTLDKLNDTSQLITQRSLENLYRAVQGFGTLFSVLGGMTGVWSWNIGNIVTLTKEHDWRYQKCQTAEVTAVVHARHRYTY